MTVTIRDERTGGYQLVYTQSFWTGRRQLWYNGTQMRRQNNKQFFWEGSGGTVEFRVEGNLFTGTRVASDMFAAPIYITRKLAVWEFILSILVLAPGLLFGAIGGFIGGVLGYVNLEMLLRIKKVWLRIVLSIEMMIVCALLAFGTALLFVRLIGTTVGWGVIG